MLENKIGPLKVSMEKVYTKNGKYYYELRKDGCDELPSAEPDVPDIRVGKWIPCSKRLPDKYGEVLVTFVPLAGVLWTKVIIAHYSDLMGIAKPCFWIGNVGHSDFRNITNQVTAWMPLPEGYAERRTDE